MVGLLQHHDMKLACDWWKVSLLTPCSLLIGGERNISHLGASIMIGRLLSALTLDPHPSNNIRYTKVRNILIISQPWRALARFG